MRSTRILTDIRIKAKAVSMNAVLGQLFGFFFFGFSFTFLKKGGG